MKKFKYKFETIKMLKKNLEKQAQKEVAEIDLEIERWREKQQKLMNEARKAREEFPMEKISVSDIAFRKNHQQVLKRMIEDTTNRIGALENQRQKKMKELVERSKEHKIFESLREKHLDDHVKEESKAEIRMIDEFATQKFVRSTR